MTKTGEALAEKFLEVLATYREVQESEHGTFNQLAIQKLRFLRDVWVSRGGPVVTHVYGHAYPADEEGCYQLRLRDHMGRPMLGTGAYTDAQTIDETEIESLQQSAYESTPGERTPLPETSKTCDEIARDEAAAMNLRISALSEWIAANNKGVSEFVVEQLSSTNLADDWRDTLVYAAENVHFRDPDQQAAVCDRLRELALKLCESSKAGTEQVVWSAMRRFASLLPAERAADLLEFLNRKGAVDTRMVALQCVTRVFELAPPSDLATLEPLTGRVAEYADKFLDPDVFAGGENSAIARNAVLALAALGSPRVVDSVQRVNALGRRWLSRQVQRQLEELFDGWRRHDATSRDAPAFQVVSNALAALQL